MSKFINNVCGQVRQDRGSGFGRGRFGRPGSCSIRQRRQLGGSGGSGGSSERRPGNRCRIDDQRLDAPHRRRPHDQRQVPLQVIGSVCNFCEWAAGRLLPAAFFFRPIPTPRSALVSQPTQVRLTIVVAGLDGCGRLRVSGFGIDQGKMKCPVGFDCCWIDVEPLIARARVVE